MRTRRLRSTDIRLWMRFAFCLRDPNKYLAMVRRGSPEADLVSAVLADGLLYRVALEAMHPGHLTLGIFDGGCGIQSMLSDRARLIEICPLGDGCLEDLFDLDRTWLMLMYVEVSLAIRCQIPWRIVCVCCRA